MRKKFPRTYFLIGWHIGVNRNLESQFWRGLSPLLVKPRKPFRMGHTFWYIFGGA